MEVARAPAKQAVPPSAVPVSVAPYSPPAALATEWWFMRYCYKQPAPAPTPPLPRVAHTAFASACPRSPSSLCALLASRSSLNLVSSALSSEVVCGGSTCALSVSSRLPIGLQTDSVPGSCPPACSARGEARRTCRTSRDRQSGAWWRWGRRRLAREG